jgi:prepilin peptidase CpaA
MAMKELNLLQIFVAALVLTAGVWDVRTRRIPNALTFSAAIAGLIFHGVTGGWTGAGWSLAGWFVGAALFFPFFALRGMGAGDVKLLAAVGAWLFPAQAVLAALLTSIAGGVIGVAVALNHRYLTTALWNVWTLLTHWRVAGIQPLPDVTLDEARGPRLAYAVPIAIGTMVTLWLR